VYTNKYGSQPIPVFAVQGVNLMFPYMTKQTVEVTDADLLLVAKSDSTAIRQLSPAVGAILTPMCMSVSCQLRIWVNPSGC
jgi:hypothetical protein